MDPTWDLNGSSDVVDVSVAWDVGASKRRVGVAGVARKYTKRENQIGNKATTLLASEMSKVSNPAIQAFIAEALNALNDI